MQVSAARADRVALAARLASGNGCDTFGTTGLVVQKAWVRCRLPLAKC